MTKETFVATICALIEQSKENDKISKSLENIIEGYFFFKGADKLTEVLLSLLKELMNDVDDFIPWFLYEVLENIDEEDDSFSIVESDGEEFKINTPEALYDFLSLYYTKDKGEA